MLWSDYFDVDYFLVLYLPLLTSALLAALRRKVFAVNLAVVIVTLAAAAVLVVLRLAPMELSRAAKTVAVVMAIGQFGSVLILSRALVFERHPMAFVVTGPLVFWSLGLAMIGVWLWLGLPL